MRSAFTSRFCSSKTDTLYRNAPIDKSRLPVVHCAAGTNGVAISHRNGFETAARTVRYRNEQRAEEIPLPSVFPVWDFRHFSFPHAGRPYLSWYDEAGRHEKTGGANGFNFVPNRYQIAAFGCFGPSLFTLRFLPRRQQLPEFHRLFLQHCPLFD